MEVGSRAALEIFAPACNFAAFHELARCVSGYDRAAAP
jgi:hypothetical protein